MTEAVFHFSPFLLGGSFSLERGLIDFPCVIPYQAVSLSGCCTQTWGCSPTIWTSWEVRFPQPGWGALYSGVCQGWNRLIWRDSCPASPVSQHNAPLAAPGGRLGILCVPFAAGTLTPPVTAAGPRPGLTAIPAQIRVSCLGWHRVPPGGQGQPHARLQEGPCRAPGCARYWRRGAAPVPAVALAGRRGGVAGGPCRTRRCSTGRRGGRR